VESDPFVTIITALLSVIIGFALDALGFEKSVKNVVMSGYQEETNKFDMRAALRETMDLMKSVYPYLILCAAIGTVMAWYQQTGLRVRSGAITGGLFRLHHS
jgi:uncharacterized membrane protein YraQ (UPF0718 family)